jgi:hypothetical protein
MSTTPDTAATAPQAPAGQSDRGQVVDAITMPAGLGARVQAQLAIAKLAGPVLLHEDGQHWVFLVQPAPGFRGGDDLTGYGVRHETAAFHGARWVTPPRPNDDTLPSVYTVVATARRVVIS